MASLTRSFLTPSHSTSVPLFLAPAFARPFPISISATAQFSTSTPNQRKPNWALKARPKIDRNKKRGVSAIRRTGPRSTRGLWNYPLPVPVARDHRGTNPEYVEAQDHGLWGFFDQSKQALLDPEQESSHGRAWEYKELSVKSFDDLHKLYWVCVKELNRSLTREKERTRLRAGFGEVEHQERVDVIKTTMQLIREVLVDRQLSFQQANVLVNQKTVADIFAEAEGAALEDDVASSTQESFPKSTPAVS
ncbi:hypothetical protein G647_09615 [Cladophialophora carrionii CBS 160.54]|uniref:Large ribosomal subunit protein uL29m n=1 Tax=Cladophialophora carrionii CBS 160.54 TaxID=1279043 RepID=V9DKP5_9EURO|nr:uncharacterized protein G647_09615 [Cladophialophora carrionii CBS 160.54]ETI27425.1 hypothetical protein G647_09615 [Cladophialophora carrionii CBS 160.54]